ncbi:MAG: hypothetical protein ACT4NL_13490 [Pseudomarimonas sp.]
MSYPLGNDRFAIDHGEDYFAFFRRLGDLAYFVALDGQHVVAVCAAVMRRLPPVAGAIAEKAWYVCDLKVHPDYREQRIPWQIFLHGFPGKYARCQRGYAISMNPGDGRPNRVVRMATRFSLAPICLAATLGIYSLSAQEMRATEGILRRHLGPIGYLSLAKVKDIVLQSSGAPMPLLHLQHGPELAGSSATIAEPVDGHVHMFCLPINDPLALQLSELGMSPGATASVIHHRMSRWNWRFVLTSDI